MIQTIEQQIKLMQQYILTVQATCTKPEVLEQAHKRLAELKELAK